MRRSRQMRLGKVHAREFLRLCSLNENTHRCLGAVYASAAVNRLLDVIDIRWREALGRRRAERPSIPVTRLTAWLSAHPAFLDEPARDGLGEALEGHLSVPLTYSCAVLGTTVSSQSRASSPPSRTTARGATVPAEGTHSVRLSRGETLRQDYPSPA